MKAIILAAGYATRMYPLTLDKPKPLLPLRGTLIIDYIIEQLNRLPEVDFIYVVTNDKFYTHFVTWQPNAPTKTPITVINDGTTTVENRLGAIGDISFVIKEANIDDELVVIAGDNYFTYDLKEQYDFFKEKNADTLTAKKLNDVELLKSFAVAVLDENHKVVRLVEKPPEPPSDTAVYATYFYLRETLSLIEQYLKEGNNADAPGYFPQWLHTRKDVYAYIMNGDCYDIGTIKAYEAFNSIILNKKGAIV